MYLFLGCFLCSSTSRATACYGIAKIRIEFCVFGGLTTSFPLILFTCFVTEMVLFSISQSVQRRAGSSPLHRPVVSFSNGIFPTPGIMRLSM